MYTNKCVTDIWMVTAKNNRKQWLFLKEWYGIKICVEIITLDYLGEILNKFSAWRNIFQACQIKRYLLCCSDGCGIHYLGISVLEEI